VNVSDLRTNFLALSFPYIPDLVTYGLGLAEPLIFLSGNENRFVLPV
jgi:hypothetical protein